VASARVLATKALALAQIWGGLTGIWLVVLQVAGWHRPLSTSSLAAYAAAVAYFLLCLSAGHRLLRAKPYGAVLSCIVQAVQLVGVAFAGVAFKAYAGAEVSLLWRQGWLGVGGEVGSEFTAVLHYSGTPELRLNLLAVLALIILWRGQDGRTGLPDVPAVNHG